MIKSLTSSVKLLSGLLNKFEGASPFLFDFKFSIRLTDYPAVMELATRTNFIKEGEEIPSIVIHTRTKVCQLINTTIFQSIWNLQII